MSFFAGFQRGFEMGLPIGADAAKQQRQLKAKGEESAKDRALDEKRIAVQEGQLAIAKAKDDRDAAEAQRDHDTAVAGGALMTQIVQQPGATLDTVELDFNVIQPIIAKYAPEVAASEYQNQMATPQILEELGRQGFSVDAKPGERITLLRDMDKNLIGVEKHSTMVAGALGRFSGKPMQTAMEWLHKGQMNAELEKLSIDNRTARITEQFPEMAKKYPELVYNLASDPKAKIPTGAVDPDKLVKSADGKQVGIVYEEGGQQVFRPLDQNVTAIPTALETAKVKVAGEQAKTEGKKQEKLVKETALTEKKIATEEKKPAKLEAETALKEEQQKKAAAETKKINQEVKDLKDDAKGKNIKKVSEVLKNHSEYVNKRLTTLRQFFKADDQDKLEQLGAILFMSPEQRQQMRDNGQLEKQSKVPLEAIKELATQSEDPDVKQAANDVIDSFRQLRSLDKLYKQHSQRSIKKLQKKGKKTESNFRQYL